jgi:hypothetical protein
VLGGLLLEDQEVPQHCTYYDRRNWDEMRKAIIEPLLWKAVNSTIENGNLFASLCFRLAQFPDASKQKLFGHPLIQNEKC